MSKKVDIVELNEKETITVEKALERLLELDDKHGHEISLRYFILLLKGKIKLSDKEKK